MTAPQSPKGRRAHPFRGATAKAAVESLKSHPMIYLMSAILVIVLGAVGFWADMLQISGPSTTPTIGGASATSIAQPAESVTAPASTPSPTPQTPETFKVVGRSHACPPSNPSDFVLPDVEICVVMWCQSGTYELDGTPQRDQTQIKMKVRVTNNSTDPMDISISNASAIRLLVSHSHLPESWRPPPKTVAAGDKPILIEWAGSGSRQNYWGLPPNVFADSYSTPANVATGFYTQWEPPLLGPGESFYRPRPDVLDPQLTEGNLVFQIPVGSEIYGLAVVAKTEPTRVIGVSPYSDWKDRQVSPGYF